MHIDKALLMQLKHLTVDLNSNLGMGNAKK
jgi:hypothetical protein